MNILGLHTFAFAPQWEIERIEPHIEQAKEFGVRLIEIPIIRPQRFDARRGRAFADRWSLELACSTSLPASVDVLDQPGDGLDFLTPVLQACAEMGAPSLGGIVYGCVGRTAGRALGDAEADKLCRFLDRAARLAKSFGLKLGLAPHNRYETHLVNRASDAVRIIERIGAENIVVHLDTFHMNIEEESFASALDKAAPHLAYVTLSESNRGVPGQGMLDWQTALKAIADVGYRGPLTVMAPNHVDPELAAGLAIWRAAARRTDDVVELGLPFIRDEAKKAGLSTT